LPGRRTALVEAGTCSDGSAVPRAYRDLHGRPRGQCRLGAARPVVSERGPVVSALAVALVAAGVVVFFVVMELVTAVLPLIIILTVVPAEERQAVTDLFIAAGGARRRPIRQAVRLALAAPERSRQSLGEPYEGRADRNAREGEPVDA